MYNCKYLFLFFYLYTQTIKVKLFLAKFIVMTKSQYGQKDVKLNFKVDF